MNKKKTKAPQTLERKIHFYLSDIGLNESGNILPFNPTPALDAISQLPFTDDSNSRYLLDDDGNAICVWPHDNSSYPMVRFCQIRRTGLPQLERAGTVSNLNLAADAGLLEPVHVVFFPDNIVGADFNFYGPRLTRLGHYLRAKSENAVPTASFRPLLRQDVAEQLDHLTEIRLVNLRVKTSYLDAIHRADNSLGDAFAANADVLDGAVEDLEIILRPSKAGRQGALSRLISPLKTLARGLGLRENVERFHIKGTLDTTGKVGLVDLLHDQLITRKQILRIGERSRAVDQNSAFQAICEAHDELADGLRHAASLMS